MSEREIGTPLHHGGANFDNLDKAFVIFRLPPKAGKKRLHRQVDLICAPPARYAASVLSWSGSMMFERDLRRWTEERCVPTGGWPEGGRPMEEGGKG